MRQNEPFKFKWARPRNEPFKQARTQKLFPVVHLDSASINSLDSFNRLVTVFGMLWLDSIFEQSQVFGSCKPILIVDIHYF